MFLGRGTRYDAALYGHFGQGCLHTRIPFELNSQEGVKQYRRFMEEASDLCIRMGGLFGEQRYLIGGSELVKNIFKSENPRRIASSLQHSAEISRRRKAGAFQSAMSMLNFYINRAGQNLPVSRKRVLEAAKDELRVLYGRKRTSYRPRQRHSSLQSSKSLKK
jgi:hypothetical protein